jgi:sulfonate transport system permease protein
VIAAEFVEANRGLGYLIWQSWQTLVVENMYAGLVVVGALGVAFAALIAVAARLAMPWQRRGT